MERIHVSVIYTSYMSYITHMGLIYNGAINIGYKFMEWNIHMLHIRCNMHKLHKFSPSHKVHVIHPSYITYLPHISM